MKRSKLIDTLKGLGILFVILGHIHLTPTALKIWIYSFHMPLFFICSGLTFSVTRYDSYAAFVKSKVSSIVIPYFSLGTTLWILTRFYIIIRQLCQGTSVTVDWNIWNVVVSLFLGHRLHRVFQRQHAFAGDHPAGRRQRDPPLHTQLSDPERDGYLQSGRRRARSDRLQQR